MSHRNLLSILSFCILLLLCILSSNAVSQSTSSSSDEINHIPGASESMRSRQYSGFLDISASKHVHYYYIESEKDPASDPVVFWTNGGPGCSGMLGLYTEMGPWRVMKNKKVVRNPYSWTTVASMVFLEQPVGVGFSYTTNEEEARSNCDFSCASDNVEIVRSFFAKYPERRGSPFYIASESYGGHYIPEWTLQLFDAPDLLPYFKGYMVGNPFTSLASGSIAMAHALWGLQLVPISSWKDFETNGCSDLSWSGALYPDICWDLLYNIFNYSDSLNPYSLEFPTCNITTNSSDDHVNRRTLSYSGLTSKQLEYFSRFRSSTQASRIVKIARSARELRDGRSIKSVATEVDGRTTSVELNLEDMVEFTSGLRSSSRSSVGEASNRVLSTEAEVSPSLFIRALGDSVEGPKYDPCGEVYINEYLGDIDVQKSLNVLDQSATEAKPWEFCSDIFESWPLSDYNADTTQLYAEIFNHKKKPKNFKMLVFSGDVDGVCATVGTQEWIYSLENTNIYSLWQPLYISVDTGELLLETPPFMGYSDDDSRGSQTLSSLDMDKVTGRVYRDKISGDKKTFYPSRLSDSESMQPLSSDSGEELRYDMLGYVTKFFGSFTFATVRYAGHEVPAYQPQKALVLFKMFLADSSAGKSTKSELFETRDYSDVAINGGNGVTEGETVVMLVFALILVSIAVGFGYYFREKESEDDVTSAHGPKNSSKEGLSSNDESYM